MSEQQSPDLELAKRVAAKVAQELDLSASESEEISELILAGKKQDQGWFELAQRLADREEGVGDGTH